MLIKEAFLRGDTILPPHNVPSASWFGTLWLVGQIQPGASFYRTPEQRIYFFFHLKDKVVKKSKNKSNEKYATEYLGGTQSLKYLLFYPLEKNMLTAGLY